MTLRKTQRGRDALLAHSAGLTLAERRVLILCDGVRGRDDLVGLLGAGALMALAKLLSAGYLSADEPAVPSDRRPVGSLASAPGATRDETRPIRADAVSRRSLAVSKMYLLDMLQLQRDPESVSLRAAIQTSPSDDELLYRMMKALRHLQAVASASYALRVAERLAEILPERYLPKLEQARAAWPERVPVVA